MSRPLSQSLVVLVLLMSTVSVASVARAEACLPDGSNAATCIPSGADTAAGGAGVVNTQAAAQADAALTQTVDPVAAKTTADNQVDSDSWMAKVMQWIMSLFAWLVGVAAIALDGAVYYTVVKMGSYVNNLSAIGVTWSVLRDFGNILLIFGFLAVGITTIISYEWGGVSYKMLPMMLVAAVFLNFSLFIAEAMVDTSNLFATQFYTQINGGVSAGDKSFSLTNPGEGISNKIMAQLGLQTIYTAGRVNPDVFKAGNSIIIGFMGIILFIITAFVLFSLAFILIARFVALIFLIIASPLGFAGLALPGFKKVQSMWWQNIFEQCMTAPVLMLMLYLALRVITDARFLTGFDAAKSSDGWVGWIQSSSLASAGLGNLVGFASVILSFLVAMGLLLVVVVYSKRWSAFGGTWATNLGGKLSFGATSALMRNTAGAGSYRLSKYIRGTRFGATKTGRIAAQTFGFAGKSSFDVRGTGAFKNIPFGNQLNLGKPQAGGFEKKVKDTIKEHEEYAKSLTGQGQSRENLRAIENAEKKQKEAEDAKKIAETQKDTIQKKVKEQEEAIKALEKEKSDDILRWQENPENEKKLTTARQELDTSKVNLAGAITNLTQATDALKNAEKAKNETKKTAESETSSKGAQAAYAKNVQESPIMSWAVFGSGSQDAAKKILKEATKKKSKAEELVEELETAAKKAREDELKEEKKPEEPDKKEEK